MRNIFMTVLGLIMYLTNFGQPQQEIAFDKGVNLLKKGSYEEAIKIFSDVIPKATDKKLKKFCHVYRAFSYNGLSDFKKSVTELDTAIIIDPYDIATFIDRSNTFL